MKLPLALTAAMIALALVAIGLADHWGVSLPELFELAAGRLF